MLTQSEVDAFRAASKTMVGRMEWVSRHGGGSHVSQVPLESGGLVGGDLIALQLSGDPRSWKFKLRMGGTQVLRWEFLPSSRRLRRHRNPKPTAPGFPLVDRSLVHEHVFVNGECGRHSRPLPDELDVQRHAEAFAAFCTYANISPNGYVEPPNPQLEIFP